MSFSYASSTSGPSAGGIGWFNFETITINPGDNLTNLSGTLNDGTSVSFNLSLTQISGSPRGFVATVPPTFAGANFGVSGYTSITGNVALNGAVNPLPGTAAFTINNIVVTDVNNNPVPNYSVIIADAERTNGGEQWQWQSNGGGWIQLAQLGGNPPTLTGLNTQTAVITGNSLDSASAYVLYTQAPTQLVLTSVSPVSSRQAFAIGFAITRVALQKNIAGRIDPSDQFVLDINGAPAAQATTTGNTAGIQSEIASTFATPGNAYTFNESMAAGSASSLAQYTSMVAAANATPAGSVPPTGNFPITFTPALGDNVTYTVLNTAPEVFTKTVDKAFADIGEVLTYTVRIDNPNNFALNNVLVSDATPAGTIYLGNILASTAYTGTDLPTGITLTTIVANGFATITWQVQVNSTAGIPNPIPNVAQVNVPGGTVGNSTIASTQINTAFVTMNKMTNTVFASTGDVITYTIMLNNAGNVPANNVIITDAIPVGTSFVPGSLSGATGTPPTLNLTGSIAAGGSSTISFQVVVNDSLPVPNPIVNNASSTFTYTVDPSQPNGVSGNSDSNTVSTQINVADISTVKTVTPTYADSGTILTYTLVLTNNGNVTANNVVITDTIPTGTTFVTGSVVGATGTPPTLTLTAPIIAGDDATVSFQVMVNDTFPIPNAISNSASAAFTYTVDPEDPDEATGTSNSNSVTTPVNHADLLINKAVDKAYADVNDVLTYTIQLQNRGNTSANNVTINDIIPAGTTFINGSLVGATGTPPLFALTNPIEAGGLATISFQVQVGNNVPAVNPLENNVTTAYTYTVDPANPNGESGTGNSNTTSTQVNHAQLQATKTVDKEYADLNEVLTYTINLLNTGNAVANNITLTDVIPEGITFVPGSLSGATGTLPTLSLINPIAGGMSATITFQVKVTSISNTNPINNTVGINYKYTVDPALPNGASASTTSNAAATQLNHANLTIVKSADKFISFLGDTITYQLAITNTGNVPAEQVVITDAIVNGTNYVNGSLTVSAPFSGTPQTGIVLTNPVAPGEVISISFKATVSEMPLPNPIINIANVAYVYTVDPANPDGVSISSNSNPFRTIVFRNNYQQQINDLIESVALQQAALAAISNAEGAKIQKVVSFVGATTQELLCINKSVDDMLASITILEAILKQKMGVVDCQIDGTC